MKTSTFYHTIKTFLLTHKKHQIFLRTGKSLGHAYKEIEVIAQNDNETLLKATDSADNTTSLNDQHENCVEIKANFLVYLEVLLLYQTTYLTNLQEMKILVMVLAYFLIF